MVFDLKGSAIKDIYNKTSCDMSNVYIRKSMLGDYSFCPYKFKESWLQPGHEGESNSPGSIITKKGTRFHDFAEKFWEVCELIPMDRWDELIPEQFIPEEVEWASWWLDTERRRYNTLKEADLLDMWKPVSVETKLVDEKLKLSSTFDRLDWWDKDADELAMIEYKTGTSFYPPALMFQLAFYAIMWEDLFNFGTVTNLIVINPNLKLNGYFDDKARFRVTPKMIDNVINSVAELRNTMHRGGPYPRKCTLNKFKVCQMCKPSEVNIF